MAIDPNTIYGALSFYPGSLISTTVPEVLLLYRDNDSTNSSFIAFYIGIIELRVGIKSPITKA
jgi:hypothetical protein